MKKFAVTALLTACFSTLVFAATILSPNQNNGNGGNIPGGYDDLVFNLANGNWNANLTLPKSAKNGAKITISSTAGFASILDTSNTDFPTSSTSIKDGDSLSFSFDGAQQKWKMIPLITFTPKTSGDIIPTFTATLAKYLINDADKTSEINLPATGKNNQIIWIQSDSSKQAKINPTNILFPSTFTLKNQDRYFFQYNAELKQWVPIGVPTRTINVINGNSNSLNNALTNLTASKTEVKLADSAWIPTVALPKTANDRDRVVISSTAAWQSTIDNANTNTTATLKLNKGDQYEFIYVADRAHWVLISAPKPVINANEAATKLVTLKTPLLEVNADNTSWVANVALPVTAQNNDKIVVSSDADASFNVNATGLSQKINKGDKVRFIYNNGSWKAETYQIDLLIVTSPETATKLGPTAAKLKMQEGIRISNETSQDSNALTYFRQVGYLTYSPQGKTMTEVLLAAPSDSTLQAERARVAADVVYLQSEHPTPYCGQTTAVLPKATNAYAIQVNCSARTMVHELGHVLGVNDPGRKDTSTTYNWGFTHPLANTVMMGTNKPHSFNLYSNPNIYSSDYGIRLGEENKFDSVRTINQHAEMVSKYYAGIN